MSLSRLCAAMEALGRAETTDGAEAMAAEAAGAYDAAAVVLKQMVAG